jgi:superfamily II DNA or RNA helicase
LSFPPVADLLARVRALPFSRYDPETRTWTCLVCAQSVDALRRMHYEGLIDAAVDTLLGDEESPGPCRDAVLRAGTLRRPFLVEPAMRDDGPLFAKLRAIPGSRWERKASAMSYGPNSAAALAELVDKGLLDDPSRLLSPSAITVVFDTRSGDFSVRGDERAAARFKEYFPARDVVGAWQGKGLDVGFADAFSEEVYRGELARAGDGFVPDGMLIAPFAYQAQNIAVALERTGLAITDAPGLGKCLHGDSRLLVNGTTVKMQDVWDRYAHSFEPGDGGDWAYPKEDLVIWSVDETGTMVNTTVSRLYRQHVRESLARVRLDDGSAVTVTRAHKLLSVDGWTNQYKVGQRVAVPTRMLDGKNLDWVTIESIEDVEHDGYVYDLEVPELHNYVAEGIICHNTASAIGVGLELCVNRGDIPRVVCVVPGAVRTQWASEITRFTGCEDVVIVEGDAKKRNKAYQEAADARWLIVHYDILSRDKAKLAPLVSGSLLIADEAHRLKSPTAQRTKVMRDFANKAARRLALTGTPVENDPGEWYSVLSGFAMPGLFGSAIDFLNRYSFPGRFGGFEGARNLAELRDRSKAHYMRHTKAEVADHLPPLRVQTLYIDPEPAYANALRRAHREARDEIATAALERASKSQRGRAAGALDGVMRDEVETGAEMTAVGMLRLMCSSPRLVATSEAGAAEALREGGLVPDADGPKLDELRVRAAEMQAAGQRVVIFTFSKRMANLIAERFDEDGIRHVLFTGDTKHDDRDKAVAAFQSAPTDDNPGPTAFVATDAGAEGLNLGRQCSTLINVDVPWTPGRLIQRGNRIHRVDGSADVHYLVINMTLRGTLEEGILKMIERKADLADAIFGESSGRRETTGRRGRSVFEEAMDSWNG